MIHRVVVLMLVLAACSGEATEPAKTSSTVTVTEATPTSWPNLLAGFAIRDVRLSGLAWTVAVADTGELRSRGLRGVADLGDLEGMLFVFDDVTQATFTMRDTLIPLDIAFFAGDGTLVDLFTMIPCEREPCPTYAADGPFRYALEVPVGAFAAIDRPFLDLGG